MFNIKERFDNAMDTMFCYCPNKANEKYVMQINFSFPHYFFFNLFIFLDYILTCIYAYNIGHYIESRDIYYHFDNSIQTILFSSLLYFVAGYNASFNYLTMIGCVLSTFVYEGLVGIDILNRAIFPINNWSVAFGIVMVTVFLIIIALFSWHFFYAYKLRITKKYIFVACQPLSYLLMSIILYAFKDFIITNNPIRYHLHHWILAYTVLFFLSHPAGLSRFASGIFLAVFINGAAIYGFDSIFEN